MLNHISIGSYFILGNILILLIIWTFFPFYIFCSWLVHPCGTSWLSCHLKQMRRPSLQKALTNFSMLSTALLAKATKCGLHGNFRPQRIPATHSLSQLPTLVSHSKLKLPCMNGWITDTDIQVLLCLWEDLHSGHGASCLFAKRLTQDCVEN